MPNIPTVLTVLCLLTGCAQFPVIDAAPSSAGGQTPSLVPIDNLLAQADAPAADRAAPLPARAARLKARAALMRGPILDPATRERLAAAIQAEAR